MASSKPSVNTAAKAELPVLIIGAGLAGLTVALHMAESQPVILMAKRGLGEAATAWAQGGIVGVGGGQRACCGAGGAAVRRPQGVGGGEG